MDGDSPILPLIMTVSAQGAGSVIIFYVILFVLLVMGGAYFAGAEMALASVNRIRMMSLEDNGDKRARRVLYILDNFDKALSTILIGNNIMHIGCATIATLIATKLWGEGAVAYSTIITTVVLFFVSEMLPKFYAKACNERMALSVAGSLVFLMKALTPLSFLFTKFSREVSKPFVEAAEEEPTVTEDELHDIIETGVEEGSIDDEKGELMQSALEFSETLVSDVYTPWSSVVTVSANMSASDIAATIKNCQYSRLPYIDKHGRVIGVLHIRRFLKRFIAAGNGIRVESILSRPQFVTLEMPVDDLLPHMSKTKTHIAIVNDADGNAIGIITVEDILEELVGEIYDESDTPEPEAAQSCGFADHREAVNG